MQVAIENVNINFNQGQSPVARAFIEAILRMPDAPTEEPASTGPVANAPIVTMTPPNIGEYWTGQGGIYAGVARGRDSEHDYHLILCTEAPAIDMKWQVALDHAKTITADGHTDFSVPSRFESALLYANLQDQFDTDYWCWTSTQYSELSAWIQSFDYGGQGLNYKGYERRCRFVRRLVL